jgi:stage III sporulation protein AA
VISGGHRIGVCGEVVYENGKIKNIKNICSLNIRVAHQIFGCADTVMPQIIVNGIFQNTLIVSPPGCGKTTLLRDIIRLLSNGIKTLGFSGKNVSLIDERGEIASCYEGVPTLDIGIRTDVMSNIDKSTGMSMVIRSMAPDIIATDEIGSSDDVLSIKAAILSGVKVIFTMHGDSLKSILENPNIKELLDMNIFSKIILLSSGKIPGIVEKIYDGGAYVTN